MDIKTIMKDLSKGTSLDTVAEDTKQDTHTTYQHLLPPDPRKSLYWKLPPPVYFHECETKEKAWFHFQKAFEGAWLTFYGKKTYYLKNALRNDRAAKSIKTTFEYLYSQSENGIYFSPALYFYYQIDRLTKALRKIKNVEEIEVTPSRLFRPSKNEADLKAFLSKKRSFNRESACLSTHVQHCSLYARTQASLYMMRFKNEEEAKAAIVEALGDLEEFQVQTMLYAKKANELKEKIKDRVLGGDFVWSVIDVSK
jgi:hypothetical protein